MRLRKIIKRRLAMFLAKAAMSLSEEKPRKEEDEEAVFSPVVFGREALEMIAAGRALKPTKVEQKPVPLTGSLQERLERARKSVRSSGA